MKEIPHTKRIWEIDFVRGVIIIGMVFDHFMFFLGNMMPQIFGKEVLPLWLANTANFAHLYWEHPAKLAVRYVGLLLLFVLVGISSRFSRSNLKRGLLTFGFGVGLSLVLLIISSVSPIHYYALFPIISCLGASMLLYYGARQLYVACFKRDPINWKWWSLGIGVALVSTGWIINLVIAHNNGVLKPGNIFLAMMGQFAPGPWNSDTALPVQDYPLVILGVHKWGNDWLGLLPYSGFTFLGGFIGEFFYAEKKSLFFRKNPEKNEAFNDKANYYTKWINWLGSKTFWVYIIHPFVLVPILFIFFWIATGTWPF